MERIKQGSQRTEELNQRIAYRNMPSSPLQPQFDIRPQSSKYAKMPIVDRRENHQELIKVIPTYDIGVTFNPGSAQGPWSGFATNINNESRLRNQFYALQKGAGQSSFIPSKESDLYKHRPIPVTPSEQPFPDLFDKAQFTEFNPCPKGLGGNFFENCTRQQIKELSSL
jgi:hypothetical protein